MENQYEIRINALFINIKRKSGLNSLSQHFFYGKEKRIFLNMILSRIKKTSIVK